MQERSSLEKIVIGLAALGLVVSFALIFNDSILVRLLFSHQDSHTGHVGIVVKSKSDVRRRAVRNLTWLPLSEQADVFEGDSIFTGQESGAEIAVGGATVSIGANSLLVLSSNSGQTNLDVQYGTIVGSLTGDETLKVNINGRETELSGKNTRIEIRSDGKKTELAVLQGELKVKEDGKERTIKTKEIIETAKPPPPVDLGPTQVVLESPTDGSSFWLLPGEAVSFRWRAPADEKHFVVEIATDEKFEHISARQETTDTQWDAKDLEKLGPAFWRIQSMDRKGTTTQPYRMTVVADVAPVPSLPVNEQVFEIEPDSEATTKAIPLAWDDEAQGQTYRVQISASGDFSDPVYDQKVQGRRTESEPLAVGTYFWRVREQNAKRKNPPWSEIQSFAIQKPNPEVLPAPVLASSQVAVELRAKVDPAQFDELGREDQKSFLRNSLVNKPQLSWFAVKGAKGYQVEIARVNDPQFKEPVLVKRTKTTELVWSKPDTGAYLWRVTALSEELKLGESAAPAKLNVAVAPPSTLSKKTFVDRVPSSQDLNRPLKEMELKWDPTPFAESYEVEVSSSSEFTHPQRYQTSQNDIKVSAARVGDNFWRVRPLGKDGKAIGRFSAQDAVSYQRLVDIEPPEMRIPAKESSLIFVGAGKANIVFEWAKVEAAETYTIEMSTTEDFQNVVYRQKLRATKTLVEKDLAQGRYFWRVKAAGPQLESSWAGPSAFSLQRRESRKPAKQ